MNLTVDRLLFGTPDLTDDQNYSLFLNVHKFIVSIIMSPNIGIT